MAKANITYSEKRELLKMAEDCWATALHGSPTDNDVREKIEHLVCVMPEECRRGFLDLVLKNYSLDAKSAA